VCRIVGRCIGFDSFGEFTGDLYTKGFGYIRALIFEAFIFHRLSFNMSSLSVIGSALDSGKKEKTRAQKFLKSGLEIKKIYSKNPS
jgi:hypothetical protein